MFNRIEQAFRLRAARKKRRRKAIDRERRHNNCRISELLRQLRDAADNAPPGIERIRAINDYYAAKMKVTMSKQNPSVGGKGLFLG